MLDIPNIPSFPQFTAAKLHNFSVIDKIFHILLWEKAEKLSYVLSMLMKISNFAEVIVT